MKGNIYRRGESWTYRFDLDPDPLTGQRRQATKGGFGTRKEAESAMREAMSAAERGRHTRPSRRTVADFLDEWLKALNGRVRPTTWTSYRDYRDAYVNPAIGHTALQDLSPVRINLLYTRLLANGRVRKAAGIPAGLAPKTVRNVHVMLRRALRDAVKWGYLARNPAEDAEPPTGHGRKRKVWTTEQLRAFVEHARGDRFFALWLLVATTGLRRGELAGLREEDFDLKAARVSPAVPRVVVDGYAQDSEPKTARGYRTLALDPVTAHAVQEHIKRWRAERRAVGHVSPLLFCWPDGQPVHPQTITDRFFRLSRDAGLPVIRLHDVRHSYATAALKAGVHPKIVSERLGHASVAFTLQTYSHVIEGMDEAAAVEIAAHILGTPPATDAPSPLGDPAETSDEDDDDDDDGTSGMPLPA
ncbi:MAG: site-specific integrase [Actinobacteria bacterium]|nr:site-specific integrase [Actinomycetota bacterium]MBI3688571.1 site-specific integrase [Actinomycetota bacterium]